MKILLFLLGISCAWLMVSTCAGQTPMEKEDFPEHGISIVLPDDPSYGSELERLGFSPSAELLPPFSVMVKNASRRVVVAFGVRFTKRYADGHVATSDVGSSQTYALVDPGRPNRYDTPLQGLVIQGAARLVTPDGVVDPARKGGAPYTSYRTDTPWTIIKVELDSVVFDDGEAIGPDKLDVVKRLKAHIEAQQDLMEEIANRFSRGELLHNVLQELRTTELSKADAGTLTKLNLGDVYTLVRRQYLDELSATETNAGEEAANKRIQQLKYVRRPNVRQALAGGK
jgi:hypothetical protein